MKPRWIVVIVLGAYLAWAAWFWQTRAQGRPDGPFRVLVQQSQPPVTLFEHRPSGACFLAYQPGGVVAVDSVLCQKSGAPPILLPPGLPISPEK